MNGLLFNDWSTLPFVVLALVISFTIHEFAHAYTAYKFGDPTAYQLGRVSLNPMVHLDLLGSIMMLLAGIGWAKPVPVNPGYFKNPRAMTIAVTAAGPLSNLVLAFLSLLLYALIQHFGWMDTLSKGSILAINVFFSKMVIINLSLLLFNLIPIPPLDGYRIVQELLPLQLNVRLQRFEQWAFIIMLLLLYIRPLRQITLDPYFSLINNIYQSMLIPIGWILG